MFAWAPIPGIGFGHSGDGFVRFALVENDARIRQAVRGIRKVIEADPAASSGDAKG